MKRAAVFSEIAQMIRALELSCSHIDCACTDCYVTQNKIDALSELKKRLEMLE